ncbi:MAG: hypothetical protein V1780_05645 [Chloroflexota bacterium]
MGLAAVFILLLIALATVVVMLWGAFEALVHVGRFLWRLLWNSERGDMSHPPQPVATGQK